MDFLMRRRTPTRLRSPKNSSVIGITRSPPSDLYTCTLTVSAVHSDQCRLMVRACQDYKSWVFKTLKKKN